MTDEQRDWIAAHRDSITFGVMTFVGLFIVYFSVVHYANREFTLIGLGLLGAPGYLEAASQREA